MSLLSGIKRAAGGMVHAISNPGATIKNPSGSIKDIVSGGALTGDTFGIGRNLSGMFDKAPKAPVAGEDPNVTALRQRLFGEAQDFDKNLGNYQNSASDQIQREGDMALQSGIKGNNENFNRRGLLYSGLRESGEQGVKGRVASAMSSQKAQSNKELTDMASAKYQKAAQVGLQGYQDAINREAEIAGISLQNQVARAQMNQQLGQLGGYGAATAYNNYQNRPVNMTTSNTTQSPNQYAGQYDTNNPNWASS